MLFALYCLAACLLLFRRVPGQVPGWNLCPLKSIESYLRVLSRRDPSAPYFRYALVNLLGNLALLMPMGLFLPKLFSRQRCFGWFLFTSLLLGVGIECIQYVTAVGVLDVDDLFLNISGAVLGYWVWRVYQVIRRKYQE